MEAYRFRKSSLPTVPEIAFKNINFSNIEVNLIAPCFACLENQPPFSGTDSSIFHFPPPPFFTCNELLSIACFQFIWPSCSSFTRIQVPIQHMHEHPIHRYGALNETQILLRRKNGNLVRGLSSLYPCSTSPSPPSSSISAPCLHDTNHGKGIKLRFEDASRTAFTWAGGGTLGGGGM